MKTHKHLAEMEPPFECDCCGVEFDEYATLEEHKKRHLNRPDFQCIECDRVLKRRTAFKLHMQTHVSRKPLHDQNSFKLCNKFRINFDFVVHELRIYCSQNNTKLCAMYAVRRLGIRHRYNRTSNTITMI